jgi:hypothetical protein
MDGDDVEARLDAVERALADGDTDLAAVADAADRQRELDELRDRIDELEAEVTELAASVQAVRGYVGNVRTVNRDVERRADAALAKAEALERRATDHGNPRSTGEREAPDRPGDHGDRRQREQRSPPGPNEDGAAETPGDIARRITGRDGSGRRHESSRTGRGRADVDQRREGSGKRSRARDESEPATAPRGTAAGDDEGDGLFSGLRDAL